MHSLSPPQPLPPPRERPHCRDQDVPVLSPQADDVRELPGVCKCGLNPVGALVRQAQRREKKKKKEEEEEEEMIFLVVAMMVVMASLPGAASHLLH